MVSRRYVVAAASVFKGMQDGVELRGLDVAIGGELPTAFVFPILAAWRARAKIVLDPCGQVAHPTSCL